MPEEIWIDTVRGEDGFLAVGGADLPRDEASRNVGHFIRADIHDAAIAAARAEGVREGMLKAVAVVVGAGTRRSNRWVSRDEVLDGIRTLAVEAQP